MNSENIGSDKNIIFYTNEENETRVEVALQNEDVWLNVKAIAELFEVNDKAIYKHITNIYSEGELEEKSTFSILENMGETGQMYKSKYYNLDMIISIGFRVNSKKAIKFRTWANRIIKDYMIQGFALDDERFLKGQKTDQEYFKRLLEKVKLIRTSERMLYQKVTDIFAECSIDYDKKSETAKDFYSTIQNKFHYAITSNTAAEIIYKRADSSKDNMGLTNWKDSPDGKILKSDVTVAKNYLLEEEIKNLNNIVNIFLDVAEDNAERKILMYMNDWKNEVDNILKIRHYEILTDKGKISAEQAKIKAEGEFEKYKVIQDRKYISDFDKLLEEANKYMID